MSKKETDKKLLILTLDKTFSQEIDISLCLKNFVIFKAKSHQEALSLFDKEKPDIIIIDIEKKPAHEMDLINYIKMSSPKTEVIILTTLHELENATHSLRYGASFYLMKPITCSDLQTVIEKLSLKIARNKEYLEFEHRILYDLMGANQAMQKLLKLAIKIAPTSSTVLIGGESGTGKEFFAKIIHRMSQRLEGKFIAVNCGGIPETLFESEFFGHKKGSFTGADRDKMGLVEEAQMGTLFLDEVGELSLPSQVKLLRFLQDYSFRRVGDSALRTVNTRIIAATNKDLVAMVKEGTFREDLFYRLNVFYLNLPPLRERKETLPSLINLFVHRNNATLNKNITTISKAAELLFAEYDYPGNVRELENIIEHAMILAETKEITERDLPEFMLQKRVLLPSQESPIQLQSSESKENIVTLAEIEKQYIHQALEAFSHNYTETAEALGISRSTLWRKIRTYNLDKKDKQQ